MRSFYTVEKLMWKILGQEGGKYVKNVGGWESMVERRVGVWPAWQDVGRVGSPPPPGGSGSPCTAVFCRISRAEGGLGAPPLAAAATIAGVRGAVRHLMLPVYGSRKLVQAKSFSVVSLI